MSEFGIKDDAWRENDLKKVKKADLISCDCAGQIQAEGRSGQSVFAPAGDRRHTVRPSHERRPE